MQSASVGQVALYAAAVTSAEAQAGFRAPVLPAKSLQLGAAQ